MPTAPIAAEPRPDAPTVAAFCSNDTERPPVPLLLLIVVALITYGSLYPFAFDFASYDPQALDRLLAIDPLRTSRGDILANVALFVPFGLVGVLVATRSGRRPMRVVLILLLGLALAAVLQVAQLFTPSRVPTFTDVVWNGVGLLLGAAAASVPLVRRLVRGLERTPGLSVPVLLIAAWIAYRLVPFVPSIDFQLVKDSLKPLLLTPHLTPLGVFHDFVAWSVVLHLWAAARRRGERDRLVLFLIAGVFVAEVFILENTVSANNVAGVLLAVAAWWLVLHRMARRAAYLAALLLALLVLQGLAPFELRATPATFRWIPFAGALDGSFMNGLVNMVEKLFLYGSLVWLLRELRFGWAKTMVVTAGALAMIEAAQTRFAHHTPEITDPILAILISLLLALLTGGGRAPVGAAPRGRRT